MVNKVCIIAGEPSGDMYAGRLVNELKKINPAATFFGIGGEKLKGEGCEILFHINQMSFMGFYEVTKNITFINNVFKTLIERTKLERPDVLILIDYPGFNLRFAEKVRPYCKKIVYYICPQVWAWGKRRIKKMRKIIDKALVIFPFEEDFYKREKVNVEYVGHPLIEIIEEYKYCEKNTFFEKYNFDNNKKLLTIFPGSRKQEIHKHIDILSKTANKIIEYFDINIGFALSQNVNENEIIEELNNDKIKIIKNDQYNLLKYSDFAFIKSGTATIETAIFRVPMVIFYKTAFMNFLIGKMLVNLDFFGMANIIAGKKIVPELLQSEVNVENFFEWMNKFMTDKDLVEKMKIDLFEMKVKLGTIGATERAAKIIHNLI